MPIGIINYGAGNLFSLTAALSRQGLSYGMVEEAGDLARFDRFIIPGVGQAESAFRKLQQSGLAKELGALEKPVLGICLGMQLLTSGSEEGPVSLLNLVPLPTRIFTVPLKIPHMGWNKIEFMNDSPLFRGLKEAPYVYFVHSYFVEFNPTFTIAVCRYGIPFSAAIQFKNYYGVQFHPEKSGRWGEALLKNFSKI